MDLESHPLARGRYHDLIGPAVVCYAIMRATRVVVRGLVFA
jgi:hypothetical protein